MLRVALINTATAPRTQREWFEVALLAAVATLVLFADASIKELHGTSVFYASLVREIVTAGDPMLVFTDERAYLLKPPLVIWLSALGAEVFGLTNFGVTAISRLAGVGLVMLTYVLFSRWWSHSIAWLAAFVLLTNSTFVQFTATLRMDSLLMFGLMLSLVGWSYRERGWGAAALFGGISVAVLSKGPLGFASIPLIFLYAVMHRQTVPSRIWRYAWLLLPIVAWYGALYALHGNAPFAELGADTLRASAAPQLEAWQSIIEQYVVKPARRYWPWLPFMAFGLFIVWWRAFDASRDRAERINGLFVSFWVIVVIGIALIKPDRDIRYFYPALPALGLLASLSIMHLLRGTMPKWAVPGLCALVVVALVVRVGADDTRIVIEQMRNEIRPDAGLVAIGGYPVGERDPRRQNTHRDWVHFYMGQAPLVMSWEQARETPPDFTQGVFLTRSRGREPWLAEFGLEPRYTTKEMILALPK